MHILYVHMCVFQCMVIILVTVTCYDKYTHTIYDHIWVYYCIIKANVSYLLSSIVTLCSEKGSHHSYLLGNHLHELYYNVYDSWIIHKI